MQVILTEQITRGGGVVILGGKTTSKPEGLGKPFSCKLKSEIKLKVKLRRKNFTVSDYKLNFFPLHYKAIQKKNYHNISICW